MIRIGLADDHAIFLNGISQVIASQSDMTVAWTARTGEEALECGARAPVDIVLMDVQMPGLDGISATQEYLERFSDTKIIILTTFDDEDYILGGVQAGASGFLLKDAEPEVQLESIRTVHRGEAVISPRATKKLLSRLQSEDPRVVVHSRDRQALGALTERETEVLVAIGRGWSNAEIAQRLFISMPTVKTHVGRVMFKTQSRDRVHVALFAFRTGLVDRDSLLG